MSTAQSDILLCTINASYIHASFGLRYLYANMPEELRQKSVINEFTTHLRPADIVEKILLQNPRIISFGVYIWNTVHTTEVVQLLKIIAPSIKIIIGGPEVSYEYTQQKIYKLADHLITGAGDTAFGQLCKLLLNKQNKIPEIPKVFEHQEPPLSELKLPYQYYTAEDIKNRLIYVEASRGCPFKCEFCLSALEKTALPFDIDGFLSEMDKLYQRGARNFKFVDRTFNLKTETSLRILNFFLDRLDDRLFLHFEIIPDRLPEPLKATIQKFPPGCLQFEIGVQTFNQKVQNLISRKQDNDKTIANLKWLRNQSNAHIHADLIFALPGEDIKSFALGFDTLYKLRPHDIQVGILKRLRGTPIIRHTDAYQLKFDTTAPYSILYTSLVDFLTIQKMVRFARYWELIANSGKFQHSLEAFLEKHSFYRFYAFSDWLYHYSAKTHQISLRKLFDYLYYGLIQNERYDRDYNITKQDVIERLLMDYQNSGLKGLPEFYKHLS